MWANVKYVFGFIFIFISIYINTTGISEEMKTLVGAKDNSQIIIFAALIAVGIILLIWAMASETKRRQTT